MKVGLRIVTGVAALSLAACGGSASSSSSSDDACVEVLDMIRTANIYLNQTPVKASEGADVLEQGMAQMQTDDLINSARKVYADLSAKMWVDVEDPDLKTILKQIADTGVTDSLVTSLHAICG